MDDMWMRIIENLQARVSGPLHFRLVLQPLMAAVFAVISGLKDAKAGEPPYFWSLLTDPSQRVKMLEDGWKSIGRILVLALVLDCIEQIIVQHFVYPGEAIIVSFILVIFPYLVLRGLVTRLARRQRGPPPASPGEPPDSR